MVSGSLATLSADSPRLLRWFSAAPALSRRTTTSARLAREARCSGVAPFRREVASSDAPAASRASTAATWPP